MTKLLEELFGLAMDELPYDRDPAFDKAEEALEEYLGQEGKPLLRSYEDAFRTHDWEDMKDVFFRGLALGLELGSLTLSAGACRRR